MNKVFLNTIGEKVIVKGGGSSGGGSGLRYFSLDSASFEAVYFSALAKYRINGECMIGPTLCYAGDTESIDGIQRSIEGAAFDFSTKITIYGTTYNSLFELWGISSVEEFISMFTIIKEITEEQFYDPNFNPWN